MPVFRQACSEHVHGRAAAALARAGAVLFACLHRLAGHCVGGRSCLHRRWAFAGRELSDRKQTEICKPQACLFEGLRDPPQPANCPIPTASHDSTQQPEMRRARRPIIASGWHDGALTIYVHPLNSRLAHQSLQLAPVSRRFPQGLPSATCKVGLLSRTCHDKVGVCFARAFVGSQDMP